MTLPDELFLPPHSRKEGARGANVLSRVTEIQVLLAAGRGELVPHASDERAWVRQVLVAALARAGRDKHAAEIERYRHALALMDASAAPSPRRAG